ncbi:MAG: hypothetical protein KME05_05750 [Gloeocapsa sp. UFS-A4-WI-NPMV-4B04]|jgi:hypothetical protein|nr:hypothetical protein [Gloeocapsa sp. UFS-A4-WI-NPMV-4B04]
MLPDSAWFLGSDRPAHRWAISGKYSVLRSIQFREYYQTPGNDRPGLAGIFFDFSTNHCQTATSIGAI